MQLENKIVSSRDVALAAGVSRTVVSWVVNGTAARHRLSKATEKRVKAMVAQLNYEPGRFLRSLAGLGGDDLSAALSTAGYCLVPVANAEELQRLTIEGMVGVLYRTAGSGQEAAGSDQRPVSETLPVSPALPPSVVEAVPVIPTVIPTLGPVDADVPSALVAGEDPLGANADGTSASTLVSESVPDVVAPQAGSGLTEPPITNNQQPITAAAPPPPGRDDLCPCGSGKKYKKCHGKWGATGTVIPLATATEPPITNNQQPITAAAPPPPGRDDPCPCGSGKKYKKCHGKWGGS